MGHRRIPTISGGEPKEDPFFQADMQMNGDDATLDLHGMKPHDAIIALDIFLANALVANFTAVKVIHGHGKGILANKVNDVLRKHRLVKRYQPSNRQPGAAVVVLLKDGS